MPADFLPGVALNAVQCSENAVQCSVFMFRKFVFRFVLNVVFRVWEKITGRFVHVHVRLFLFMFMFGQISFSVLFSVLFSCTDMFNVLFRGRECVQSMSAKKMGSPCVAFFCSVLCSVEWWGAACIDASGVCCRRINRGGGPRGCGAPPGCRGAWEG